VSTYKPFIVKIPVDYIPSENQRLQGRHLSTMARSFKDSVYNSLCTIDNEEFYKGYSWIYDNMSFKLDITFILNTSFWRRDTDNMCKMTIDCLFEWLELNDSSIVSMNATKYYAPSSDCEYIILALYQNEINYMSYEEFRPVSS
jgi:Holliday junction resolvase RusA-like endonuclease